MPEQLIFHVDVNSAFLSWEACRKLALSPDTQDIRLIPSVIGGDESKRHGIVLAKSTPAKKYGITTGEPLSHAKRKCPDLEIFAPHFDYYVSYSDQLMALLREYAPEVEPVSIDEAYCNFTGTQNLYGDMVVFANKLKDTIYERLGFTVNIGISTNRLLAKMASDFKKPNLVHTLFPDEVPIKMWHLPVSDLFYVGGSTVKKLHRFGIRTIGDLAKFDYDILVKNLGKHGDVIWNFANGREGDDTLSHTPSTKSFGNSTTLSYDVTDTDTAHAVLLSLCETVAYRIRNAKSHISVVTVTIVDYEFNRSSHRTTLSDATDITDRIYETACRLFDTNWNRTPIRLLGVSTEKVSDNNCMQYTLFDTETNEKLTKLNSALDQIRTRYGEDAVKRARFIDKTSEQTPNSLNKAKRNSSRK